MQEAGNKTRCVGFDTYVPGSLASLAVAGLIVVYVAEKGELFAPRRLVGQLMGAWSSLGPPTAGEGWLHCEDWGTITFERRFWLTRPASMTKFGEAEVMLEAEDTTEVIDHLLAEHNFRLLWPGNRYQQI